MRSIVSTILLLSTVIPFTLADYAISSPGTGTTWNKGQTVKVQWTVTSASDQTANVKLLRGQASNLQYVTTLCSGVNPSDGYCTCTVPENLESDRDYAVTVGNDVNHLGYSSFFTLVSNGAVPEQKGCPNFGGQNCPATLPCCSSAGYCGDTDEYCGNGCKSEFSFNKQCVKPGGAPVSTPEENPSTEKPKNPSTKKPSTKEPTKHSTKKPSTKEPKKHSAKKHSTKKHSTKKHSTKKHSTKKHLTEKPLTKKPLTKKPLAKKPLAKKPSIKKGGW